MYRSFWCAWEAMEEGVEDCRTESLWIQEKFQSKEIISHRDMPILCLLYIYLVGTVGK